MEAIFCHFPHPLQFLKDGRLWFRARVENGKPRASWIINWATPVTCPPFLSFVPSFDILESEGIFIHASGE